MNAHGPIAQIETDLRILANAYGAKVGATAWAEICYVAKAAHRPGAQIVAKWVVKLATDGGYQAFEALTPTEAVMKAQGYVEKDKA